MATSGSISTSVKFGGYTLTLTQTSQDIANNCSYWTATLTYTLNAYGKIVASATQNITITVDGANYTGTYAFGTVDNSSNSKPITKTIFTKTGIKVSHANDGTKTFSIGFSAGVNITYSGVYIGTTSKSGSITANTIPRTTTVSVSATSVTLGNAITINTPRASTSFDHALYYWAGDSGWIHITSAVYDSYAWTVPLSIANYFTTTTSGTVSILCETYNSGTYIGATSTSFTIAIPTSIAPSVSSISISEATEGIASKFAGFVKTKSTLKVTPTASGSYGSTIVSYLTYVDGVNYSGSTFTSNVLKTSGTLVVKTSVTDSRGRTASKETTITVYDYYAPQITKFTVTRCLADGTIDDTGTCVKFTISASISPVNNKNTHTFKLQYLNSSNAWTDITSFTSSYSYTDRTYIDTRNYDANKTHATRLLVSDYFTSTTSNQTVLTAFTLINFNTSGKGIGIGKVSENDNLDIALPVHPRKGFTLQSYNTVATTSEDTVDKWGNEYIGVHFNNDNDHIINQPSTYGFIFNIGNPGDVHQLWFTQPSGSLYHRGGNANGWNGSWIEILDSWNFHNYCLPKTGGTVNGYTHFNNEEGTFGHIRTHAGWIGIHASTTDADKQTNRKGWIGHNGTNDFNISNDINNGKINFNVSSSSNAYKVSLGVDSAGYMGFVDAPSNYFRSPSNGFIPYSAVSGGTCSIGTSGWNFKSGYIYNMYSTAYNNSSDRKLKNNIQEINKAKDFILGLKPCEYTFKDGDSKGQRKHMGFIAQDVSQLAKDLDMGNMAIYTASVNTGETDETGKHIDGYYDENIDDSKLSWSLRYNEFIAPMVMTIQEQEKEINDLKDEVAQLKDLVNQLLNK